MDVGAQDSGFLRVIKSVWSDSLLSSACCNVVGVGIDVVDVDDLRALLGSGGEAFVSAAWTAAERKDAQEDPQRLAARWAGIEAAMKALGIGLGVLSPLDVEIISDPVSGAPRVHLHAEALVRSAGAGIAMWHVSLAHEGRWAVGVVVASTDATATYAAPEKKPRRVAHDR
jgi:holo-[acyl-carrier protein] synthase